MREDHEPDRGWSEVGAPLERLLEELSIDEIQHLLPPGLLNVLTSLDPSVRQPSELRKAAAEMLDLGSMVSEAGARESLLRVLPEHKRRELEDRASIEPGGLLNADWDADRLRALVGFLGGSIESPPLPEVVPEFTDVVPEYGLFPYQRTAAESVRAFLDDDLAVSPRVLLHMPTGSGKTRTAMHVLAQHLRDVEPAVVVWLANSRELLLQASEEFDRAWAVLGNREVRKVNYWGGAEGLHVPSDGVVIAGLQKIGSLLNRDEQSIHKLATRVTLLVVDEAHISVAATYNDTIALLRRKESAGLLGLSATPGRTWNDPGVDRHLSAVYGGNKVRLQIEGYDNPVDYLIHEGYLARPTFRLLSIDGEEVTSPDESLPSDELDDDPEWDTSAEYLIAVVREVQELALRHRRILVFSASVNDARNTVLLLRRLGMAAELVTGHTSAGRRAAIIKRFRAATTTPFVVANYGVLTTGFDAPGTSAVVIARPTRSLVLYSQMVGRAIRGPKANGNTTAEVVTIVDPTLPGFGSVAAAFENWEDVW
jgi:DNA repair protein RadD